MIKLFIIKFIILFSINQSMASNACRIVNSHGSELTMLMSQTSSFLRTNLGQDHPKASEFIGYIKAFSPLFQYELYCQSNRKINCDTIDAITYEFLDIVNEFYKQAESISRVPLTPVKYNLVKNATDFLQEQAAQTIGCY
jgi:hypothetical protein